MVIMFSSLFQNQLKADHHIVQKLTDTIPFTEVDVERWKQVVRLDMDNGILIGSLENGECFE